MICSRFTPITPPRAPVMPTSEMKAVPCGQHAPVGGRDVGVRAEHREHAAVEVPAHRHLLAGRLGVEVDHHHVGLVAQPGEHAVDDVERGVGGVHEHGAAEVHDAPAQAVLLDHGVPAAGVGLR